VENLVCFTVGPASFALDVQFVREVTRISSIHPLPHVPREVIGAVGLRGLTLALVDAARILDLPPVTPNQALVIVREAQPICALGVERVTGIAHFEAAQFTGRASTDPTHITGVLQDARGPLCVLDGTRILELLDGLHAR
jgi:two-component system chemotaxis response regulator CheV